MKIFRMRQKLHAQGFILHQTEQGFTVDNESLKNPFEKKFKNLEEVSIWFNGLMRHNNRLTVEDGEQFDKEWITFIETQREKK